MPFRAQRQQLGLIAAPEQRVFVLNRDRIADGERLRQLLGVEVAHPVAADPARAPVLLQGLGPLVHRRLRVELVGQV